MQVPDHFTGEGIVEKIRLIAQATGTVERGECLAKLVATDLDALAALRARIAQPRKALFVLSFLNGRPMVAGRATAADGIIKLAGAVNAVTEYEGYKPISDEAVIAARPDAVLAMERASHRLDAQTVFEHPAFVTTPAAAQKALISMEGLYLLGFGPRAAARRPRPRRHALPVARARADAVRRQQAGRGLPAMTAAAASPLRASSSWRKPMRLLVLPALLAVLVLAAAVAATIGAAGIPLHRIAAAMGLTQGDPALVDRDWLVLWSIRLPRIAHGDHRRRPAGRRRRGHAGDVPQSRSPIPRWSAFRTARRLRPPP